MCKMGKKAGIGRGTWGCKNDRLERSNYFMLKQTPDNGDKKGKIGYVSPFDLVG